MDESRIEGSLDLSGAYLTRHLSLESTQIRGDFSARDIRSNSNLLLRGGATFKGNVVLATATVDRYVELDGSTLEKTVDGNGLAGLGERQSGKVPLYPILGRSFSHTLVCEKGNVRPPNSLACSFAQIVW